MKLNVGSCCRIPKRVRKNISTSDVKDEIEQALRRSAEIDARGIIVNVDGNTVKLYGSVRAFMEKEEAERAAWASRGVTKVENFIQINP